MKAFLDRPSQPTQETKKNFEVMDLVDVNTPDLLVRFILRVYSSGFQFGVFVLTMLESSLSMVQHL